MNSGAFHRSAETVPDYSAVQSFGCMFVTMGTPYAAIRSGDYKLAEFFNDMHVELYDLAIATWSAGIG